MRLCHRNFTSALCVGLLLPLATACIYEYDRCPPKLPLRIVNDWSEATDATPEGMAYIFFPSDGSAAWRFDFPGRVAGEVALRPGKYSFLSFNDDTYNVLFEETGGYGEYTAYTGAATLLSEISPPLRGHRLPSRAAADEPTVKCPDMMWGCSSGFVSVWYSGVRFTSTSTGTDTVFSAEREITAHQRQLTAIYDWKIVDVENLDGVKAMSAALSGMAGGMRLATADKVLYPRTLTLRATAAGAATIQGSFATFGIPDAPSAPNFLSLFVVLTDGRRFHYQFDVTQQVREAPDPMHVSILIEGLVIEKTETPEGGAFDVNVDGWQSVTVNITD